VKRARPGLTPAIVLGTAFLLAAGLPAQSEAQESPLGWANSARRAAGVSPVSQDDLLSRTARAWAAVLASSGVLSHRGADGSSVLDRYRAQGGTEAHVGEIIGAGPALAAVEKGWMASTDHRELVIDPAWTHMGWGEVSTGQTVVWVVLFCQKLVDGFRLERTGGGLVVSGAFVPGGAVQARLYVGLVPVSPGTWDPSARAFAFTVPNAAGYFRLGYVSAGGAFRLTNAFTLPPGTGSPGEPARSAGTEAQP
jgi:hypothetical protein